MLGQGAGRSPESQIHQSGTPTSAEGWDGRTEVFTTHWRQGASPAQSPSVPGPVGTCFTGWWDAGKPSSRASRVSPPSGGGPCCSPAGAPSQRSWSWLPCGTQVLPSEPRPPPGSWTGHLGRGQGTCTLPEAPSPQEPSEPPWTPAGGNRAAMRSQVEARVCVLNFAGWKCPFHSRPW